MGTHYLPYVSIYKNRYTSCTDDPLNLIFLKQPLAHGNPFFSSPFTPIYTWRLRLKGFLLTKYDYGSPVLIRKHLGINSINPIDMTYTGTSGSTPGIYGIWLCKLIP